AGAACAGILAGYGVVLRRIVENTNLDVLHFSLHPPEAARLAVAFALVLFHAAAVWAGAATVRVAATAVRRPRSGAAHARAAAAWLVGAVSVVVLVARSISPIPVAPLFVAVAAAGGCALAVGRLGPFLRRSSQAARLGVLFAGLLLPAIAM